MGPARAPIAPSLPGYQPDASQSALAPPPAAFREDGEHWFSATTGTKSNATRPVSATAADRNRRRSRGAGRDEARGANAISLVLAPAARLSATIASPPSPHRSSVAAAAFPSEPPPDENCSHQFGKLFGTRMRLQSMPMPNPLHTGMAEAHRASHPAGVPMRRRRRLFAQRFLRHLGNHFRRQGRLAAGSRWIALQPTDPSASSAPATATPSACSCRPRE
jgi:hypothetical protein